MMNKQLKETLRYLRKRSTPAEQLFWEIVRDRRVNGYKFFRQHPIVCDTLDGDKIFIADFYCAERKLVIEIDGPVHDRQRDYDELRTHAISMNGLKVIRFTNDEIEQDIDHIKEKLVSELKS